MNDQILDVVMPIQFKNTLLIPIKADVEKLFSRREFHFQISIKDNKIIIQSPEILANLDFQDNIPAQETINV